MKIEKYLKLLMSVLFKKLKYSYRNSLTTVIKYSYGNPRGSLKGQQQYNFTWLHIYNPFSDFIQN